MLPEPPDVVNRLDCPEIPAETHGRSLARPGYGQEHTASSILRSISACVTHDWLAAPRCSLSVSRFLLRVWVVHNVW